MVLIDVSGKALLLAESQSFCPQSLILRLAIQDIQSQSLLVSWQAANTSELQGFKCKFKFSSFQEGLNL
ncbi:hypothetical protein Anas_02754 [Armadillidium nasatum]|uniref:Uncharacterized protein n=1 Tax=Armadillidium nasatum TaxID=96803 RepID=A0A5N5THD6_9CRUS|nr:hypothetical protein Anas_02754 [Armadillidium nasatum]